MQNTSFQKRKNTFSFLFFLRTKLIGQCQCKISLPTQVFMFSIRRSRLYTSVCTIHVSKVATDTSHLKHFHKIHHYSARSTFPVGHIENNGLDQNIRHNQTIRSLDGFAKFQFLKQEWLTAFQASKKVQVRPTTLVGHVKNNWMVQNVCLHKTIRLLERFCNSRFLTQKRSAFLCASNLDQKTA